MYSTPGGEIPSVGKVEIAWVQTPLPPVNLAKPAIQVGTPAGISDDTPMDEGDAMASTTTPALAVQHGQEHQENIDYDVADDNDWGPE